MRLNIYVDQEAYKYIVYQRYTLTTSTCTHIIKVFFYLHSIFFYFLVTFTLKVSKDRVLHLHQLQTIKQRIDSFLCIFCKFLSFLLWINKSSIQIKYVLARVFKNTCTFLKTHNWKLSKITVWNTVKWPICNVSCLYMYLTKNVGRQHYWT